MMLRLWVLFCIVGCSWGYTKSVQTYKRTSGSIGQHITSNALIWDQYIGEKSLLSYAVKSGKYVSETEVSVAYRLLEST